MNRTAFVFPGQGSQQIGMLADLAETSPVIRSTFDTASAELGFDLWSLVQNGPEEDLNRTDNTQPALLTASVALWRLWQEKGGAAPDFMAGHSLGEYSALVCAGALRFEDAVRLVQARGQFMQKAVPAGTGSMAAIIGLDDDAILQACRDSAQGEVVEAVNFNSPGQVVIAGNKDAVARAGEACKAAGAKRALPLAVSVPSHCQLMRPAAEELSVLLEKTDISTPAIPVFHNVSAATESDPALIRKNLTEQLFRPVLWVACVNAMAGQGITRTIECGPGKVLSGLNKRIVRSLQTVATGDSKSFETALAAEE